MTRPRAQPAVPLPLGLASAVPQHDVQPFPLFAAGAHQAVLPQPPVIAAVAQPQANIQPAGVSTMLPREILAHCG